MSAAQSDSETRGEEDLPRADQSGVIAAILPGALQPMPMAQRSGLAAKLANPLR